MKDLSYNAVMARNNEIMKSAVGIDYRELDCEKISFDYEGLMKKVPYSFKEIMKIQHEVKVGNTPIFELKNITKLIRSISPKGKGARIFIKDEAANGSGSFKDRRASLSVYHAKKMGYKGCIAETSGNYGAAVAAQCAQRGLRCIIVQEAYDSRKVGQPEILEKTRKCEAFGAEVVRLTVGPELFYVFLVLLEETGYFNSSLYTPYSIAGIETLGYEVAMEIKEKEGQFPDAVVITHAGGGNVTGTARGLLRAGAKDTKVIGASVDLSGLHMASDRDFNRKSFTTGHTGFGVPFATWPDRSDVPRNAARPLRYLDRYLTVTQGEVFYVTQALSVLEGLERGPAGNTSLAAAIAIAKQMEEDQIIVVQETEYTGAGKHPSSQLTFAKQNGIEVKRGDPQKNVPGINIVIPESFDQLSAKDVNMDDLRTSYVKHMVKNHNVTEITQGDVKFLSEDCGWSEDKVKEVLEETGVGVK